MRCSACHGEIQRGSRFCAWCGAVVAPPSESPTQTSVPGDGSPGSAARSASWSGSPSLGSRPSPGGGFVEDRFLPGTIIGGRYRIVGLIGRGGMGEVYRADDLTLGQPVALKFLPQALERAESRVARFLNEVRVARKVSHPHVCRVYDVGEAEGRHYLSMEYVDGEDLDSLMRRVGRLSGDKALQIARQLCMGLAAAHRLGFLHRDLKPANVMIDGRGQVRITDFGLAGVAAEFEGEEIRVGTPSFMSPEQLAGEQVTYKSDIYSMGLVLFELFTGRRAFQAETPAELLRVQREQAPPTPSSVTDGVDPAVERVIQRCLDKDARRRPDSCMAVAAALPGGDPLAAALEAGETPSPELVADAGAEGSLSTRVAVATLSLFAAALVVLVALVGKTQLTGLARPDRPPAVLTERAEEVIHRLGYLEPPADTVFGFSYYRDLLEHIAAHDESATRWSRLATEQPSPIVYWYRQSPGNLLDYGTQGNPSFFDPPPLVPGMVSVQLDPSGRLRRFDAVPPELDALDTTTVSQPDWTPMFEEAGLDPGEFSATTPVWVPAVYADTRAAWEGLRLDPPHTALRVEAAASRGRPVSFRIIEPWTRPTYERGSPSIPFGPVARAVAIAWFFGAMIGAAFFARRNLRLGRGDRKGAFRLALYMLCTWMLAWLFGAHHVPGLSEVAPLTTNLAFGLYVFCLTWVFYLALEPYLRRLWPRMIVSWVRLLDGRFRDPLVGRDVLIGALYGVAMAFGPVLYHVVPKWLSLAPPRPDVLGWSFLEMAALRGMRETIYALLYFMWQAVIASLLAVVGLLLLRLIVGRNWLAVAAAFVLMTILVNPAAGNLFVDLAVGAAGVGLWLLVLFRFGLLSVTVGTATASLLLGLPMIFDFSHWYAGRSLFAVGIVVGLAVYGFLVSLGGRSLFGDAILQDRHS